MTCSELSKEIEQLSYQEVSPSAAVDSASSKRGRTKSGAEAETCSIRPGSTQGWFNLSLIGSGKMKPSKKKAVFNSIAVMFLFQDGISDGDKEKMFCELQKRGHIVVAENDRVQYPPVTEDNRDLRNRASQPTR